MSIPPLRSRTPPPLCDYDTNGENDADFGAFTVCTDFGGETFDEYQTVDKAVVIEDSASEDSGLCTGSSIGQAHSPYETSPTTVLKTIPNGETNIFESLPITDSIQSNKSCENGAAGDAILTNDENNKTERLQNENTHTDDYTELKPENDYDDETTSKYQIDESTTTNVHSHNFDYEFPEYTEDYEDFQVFQPVQEDVAVPVVTSDVDQPEFSYSEDDSTKEQAPEKEESLNKNWDNDENNDDFDDFSDFQTSSFPNQLSPTTNQISFSQADQFHSEFTQTSTEEPEVIESDGSQSSNIVIPNLVNLICESYLWNQIHSLEDTPALRFQWNNSSSNRKLLSALKIDSRNILCNFWAKSIKSGGNQECVPLNPIKIGSDAKDIPKIQSSSIPKNIVPDPHFDWDGSGLTNPLDCGNTALLDIPHLSLTCASNSLLTDTTFNSPCSSTMSAINELNSRTVRSAKISQTAEEILSSLPDRSYLKKTYIVFKRNPPQM